MAGVASTSGSNTWGYGAWAYINNPDAASGWGSNAWGQGTWEDNAVLLSTMVRGDRSLTVLAMDTWGLGSQLSALSTSVGTAIAAISILTVAATGHSFNWFHRNRNG